MSDLSGPLDPHALAEGLRMYKLLADGLTITHIPMHWEVTGYSACDGAYNIVVTLDEPPDKWIAHIATDPALNARQIQDGDTYAAHTYQRNSFGCGVASSGMIGATPENFGGQPVQLHECEVMLAVVAAAAVKYRVDTHATVDGAPAIGTHAEYAIADGYYIDTSDPSPRWDWARLRGAPGSPSRAEAAATGQLMRTRVAQYKTAISQTLAYPAKAT